VQNPSFDHGVGRIRYYSTLSALEADSDIPASSEARKMGSAFFSQSPRAQTLAIAGAFTTAQAGYLDTGTPGALSAFTAVSDGSFSVEVDGVNQQLTLLDFSSDTSLTEVAATINTALTGATVTFENSVFRITSNTTGDSSTIGVLTAGTAGTDISGPGFLNGLQGVGIATDGYLPTTFANELALIAEAARCSGRFVYGWALDRVYRDTADQEAAATWIAGRTGFMALTSNNLNADDASLTTDIGSVINTADNSRASAYRSSFPEEYPCVSSLARLLSVDYAAEDSTITMKFKNLPSISPEPINETELTGLLAKNYNVMTLVGNNSRVYRNGETGSDTFFQDSRVGLDNLREELQVAVYNVFLRENAVRLNQSGVDLQQAAMRTVMQRYVFNGFLSARPEADATREDGQRVLPPFEITYTPLRDLTDADRAARVGPPFTIIARESGAIHTTVINVNAFS